MPVACVQTIDVLTVDDFDLRHMRLCGLLLLGSSSTLRLGVCIRLRADGAVLHLHGTILAECEMDARHACHASQLDGACHVRLCVLQRHHHLLARTQALVGRLQLRLGRALAQQSAFARRRGSSLVTVGCEEVFGVELFLFSQLGREMSDSRLRLLQLDCEPAVTLHRRARLTGEHG